MPMFEIALRPAHETRNAVSAFIETSFRTTHAGIVETYTGRSAIVSHREKDCVFFQSLQRQESIPSAHVFINVRDHSEETGAGANVIALCGRIPEPAKEKAAKIGIDDLRLDWKQTIENLRPDIVSIATTTAPHREMVGFAAKNGCHVVCEKPLATSAGATHAMLEIVTSAGVKNGYSPTAALHPGRQDWIDASCRGREASCTAGGCSIRLAVPAS